MGKKSNFNKIFPNGLSCPLKSTKQNVCYVKNQTNQIQRNQIYRKVKGSPIPACTELGPAQPQLVLYCKTPCMVQYRQCSSGLILAEYWTILASTTIHNILQRMTHISRVKSIRNGLSMSTKYWFRIFKIILFLNLKIVTGTKQIQKFWVTKILWSIRSLVCNKR